MNTYHKIDFELSKISKTRKDMCEETGISYNTIASLFKRKSENISLEILRLVARYLHVSLDYLIYDDITDSQYGITGSSSKISCELSVHEEKIILAYRAKPAMQPAVNKLLGVEDAPSATRSFDLAEDMAQTIKTFTEYFPNKAAKQKP